MSGPSDADFIGVDLSGAVSGTVSLDVKRKIFSASSKPGGCARYFVPPNQCNSHTNQGVISKPTSKCKQANTFSKTDMTPEHTNEDLLAVTISCVMLMARGHNNISDEYLALVEKYLDQVKDDNGVCPPNVERILGRVKQLRAS